MTNKVAIIKKDEISKVYLNTLFDNNTNPIACATFGAGDHCNDEARNNAKIRIWGGRGESEPQGSCKVASIILSNGAPAAMINVGLSGSPATVIDTTEEGKEHSVYELSGAFLADIYASQYEEIASSIKVIFSTCKADAGYTKAFLTYNLNHPYNEKLFESAGAKVLTQNNIESLLGKNSLHPERFKIAEGKFLECSSYDKEAPKISHAGWHDSSPCANWSEKQAVVMVVGEDIGQSTEL